MNHNYKKPAVAVGRYGTEVVWFIKTPDGMVTEIYLGLDLARDCAAATNLFADSIEADLDRPPAATELDTEEAS